MKTYNLYDSLGNWITCVRAKTVAGACGVLNSPRLGYHVFRWSNSAGKQFSREIYIEGYKAVLC